MRLEITRVEGLRNDLLLRIDRPEIETVTLSVANRAQLMTLPGMPRHREAGPEEVQGIADAKVPIEEHLRWLGVVDDTGKARQRAIAISNRNLGTNHGHVAWQRDEQPPIVRIGEDPFAGRPRSCLTVRAGGRLAIEDLTFDAREQWIQAVDGTAGDATTLRPWSSGHAQQPGRWVQIELPQPAMIAGVLSESPAAIVDTTPAVPGAPTRTGIGAGVAERRSRRASRAATKWWCRTTARRGAIPWRRVRARAS